MPAFRTGIEMSTQSGGAALADGTKGLQLLIAEIGLVPVQKTVAQCAEDIGHLHGGPAHAGSFGLDPRSLVFTSDSFSFCNGFAAACRCS